MPTPLNSKFRSNRKPKLFFGLNLQTPFWVSAALALAFLFRLAFGLCSEFWGDDERQVYLVGLKFFTTGEWPYFGPTSFRAQIPGALQGLVIGGPLFIWPTPEAPFILLNLLSFAALCLLGWYCCKRLPQVPRWFIWAWLLTAPWTLNYSTHVVNPSYVLFGSVLFFIGFWETIPGLGLRVIPPVFCNALMGFSFFWIIQFHLSAPILAPLMLVSFYYQFKSKGFGFPKFILGVLIGSALSGVFLIPTFLKYGLIQGTGGTGALFQLNLDNLKSFITILARFFSFASFELPRFLGAHTFDRRAFFKSELWLAPFGLFLFLAGIAQPLFMLVQWLLKKDKTADWKAVKFLTLGLFLLIYFSFWFTSKEPSAHTYYLFLPMAMLYSFYCLGDLFKETKWRNFAVVFLVSGVIYHTGLALHRLPTHSLYKDRAVPVSAIAQKNYKLLGEKYSDSW
ncbi:MAG TPA: hypothetical protein VIJ93_01745 [bacterium]